MTTSTGTVTTGTDTFSNDTDWHVKDPVYNNHIESNKQDNFRLVIKF